MRRRPLLGACGVAALCVAAAFALHAGGRLGSTFALFNAETENAGSQFAAGWLGAPTLATPSVSVNNASLTWTVSTHGPGSANGQGQEVLGSFTASNGTSTTCPTSGYTQIAVPSATATTYTDSGRGAGVGGEYYCYEIGSTFGTNWVTPSAAQRVQFPFAATGVTITNGGTSGRINSGDKVAVSFNNTPSGFSSSGSITVITCTSNRVLLGASSCSSTPSLGTLSGRTVANSHTFSSSYTMSANTITVTIGGTGNVNLSGSSSWSFTPSSSLKQSGNVAACTASGSGCVPTTSSSF